jgi:hypothetical protein
MRFAPEPVKLPIANVARSRHLVRETELAILAVKNTANIDIFVQIAPF